jgi:tetratricopeptide (TPR) repeat protein
LNSIGAALTDLGQPQRGIACLERSLELAREAGLAFDTIRAYDNLCQRLLWLGEFRRAADLVRDGLTFTDQGGWWLGTGVLLGHLAIVQMELGYWDQAHEAIDRAIRAGEIGWPIARLLAVPKKGELLLRQGRLDEALPLLEEILPAAETQGEFEVLGQLLPTLARVYLARGDVEHAVTVMDHCVALWWEIRPLVGSENMLGYGIEVYLQTGREETARELLRSLSTLTSDALTALSRAWLAEAQGLFAAHDGSHVAAAAQFEQAAGLWQELGCPFEVARAHRHRAESLLCDGDADARAEAELEAVAAIHLGVL